MKYPTQDITQKKSILSYFANPIILIGTATAIFMVGGIFFLSRGEMQQSATLDKVTAGKPAPNFSLPSTTGGKITLSDFKGKKNVLIYFNEGLSCDPCMQQIPELEKNLSDFEKINVVVLSVMYDPVDQLKQAESRFNIKKIPMLSYNNSNTEIDYDLTAFSMNMGRRAGHTFVLVDTNGNIIWRKDYWPGQGMMVEGGKMFVSSSEILDQVKKALEK